MALYIFAVTFLLHLHFCFVGALLFEMAHRHSAEVLSSIPKCKKAPTCLEKICGRQASLRAMGSMLMN